MLRILRKSKKNLKKISYHFFLIKRIKNLLKLYKRTKENSEEAKNSEILLKKRNLNEVDSLGKELSDNVEKIAKQIKTE